jgi:hypothetical protein
MVRAVVTGFVLYIVVWLAPGFRHPDDRLPAAWPQVSPALAGSAEGRPVLRGVKREAAQPAEV